MSTNQNNFRVHAFAVQNALQPASVGPDVAPGVTVLFNVNNAPMPNGWTGPVSPAGLTATNPYMWIQKL